MKDIFFTSIGLIMIMFGGYELFNSWEALKEINASMESMGMMASMFGANPSQFTQYFDPSEMKEQIYYNMFIYGCVFVGGVTFVLLPQLERRNDNNSKSLLDGIEIGQDVKDK